MEDKTLQRYTSTLNIMSYFTSCIVHHQPSATVLRIHHSTIATSPVCQPNELRTLFNERRFPQSSEIFLHALLEPGVKCQ